MTYSLEDFLHDLSIKGISLNDQIYDYLSVTNTDRLAQWIARLSRVRDFEVKGNSKEARALRGKKSNLIGRIFEELVRTILDGCNALRHDGNIRSTTSEIDFRIVIEPSGLCIPMLKDNGTHAIGEAKCLVSGVKTEWFNELAGILTTHSATLAILFTASPPKKLNTNHRQALALLAAKDHRVVPVGLTQINEVASGGNFLKILSEQYIRVTTHSNDLAI